jgi:hypothetical protein
VSTSDIRHMRLRRPRGVLIEIATICRPCVKAGTPRWTPGGQHLLRRLRAKRLGLLTDQTQPLVDNAVLAACKEGTLLVPNRPSSEPGAVWQPWLSVANLLGAAAGECVAIATTVDAVASAVADGCAVLCVNPRRVDGLGAHGWAPNLDAITVTTLALTLQRYSVQAVSR